MSGRKSRGIGNRGELRAAKLLTDWGRWGKVVTARKAMTGTRRGEDLVRELPDGTYEHLPYSVEVKAGEAAFTEDWIDQAREQSNGERPWLLVWMPKHCRTGREWFVFEHGGGWAMTWSSRWFEMQEQKNPYRQGQR